MGLRAGDRVRAGERGDLGTVIFTRNGPPDFGSVVAVSVRLDYRASDAGYTGTMFAAEDVHACEHPLDRCEPSGRRHGEERCKDCGQVKIPGGPWHAEEPALVRSPIEEGALVHVGPAYVGGGRHAPDGFEGRWYVVGVIPQRDGSGPYDYKLAPHPGDDWKVIIHETRVTRVPRSKPVRQRRATACDDCQRSYGPRARPCSH